MHRFNFDTAAGLRTITTALQDAAAAGGQPPLLIAVDQEGGPVKVVPWAPPALSPRTMGDAGSDGRRRRRVEGRVRRCAAWA